MAFIVPTKRGTFEIRESRSTPDGPRSRTLATFRELTDEVIERAQERASGSAPSADDLREAAIRVGAPIPGPPVDKAARETLRLLAKGGRLDPMLKHLLADALEPRYRRDRPTEGFVSDPARSATEWIGASASERGSALRDLLELADALPLRLVQPNEIGFPRLRSV
jgi:uncharacterized protein (DUF1501 family)